MSEHLRQGFRLGDYDIHPPTGTIHGPDGTRHVTPTAMDILVCLAQNPGKLISHEQLIDEVWGDNQSGESALTRCIADLRHQLDDHADNPRYIQTLPRRGYRLLAAVSALDATAESVSAPPANTSTAAEDAGLGAFFKELRRRRVVRVGLVYMVAAWVIIQVAQTTFPPLLLPDWSVTLVVILVVLGFPVALILAWAFQVESEGSDHAATSVHYVVDKNRKVDFWVITALAAVVVIMGYELYVKESTTSPEIDTESVSSTSVPTNTHSTDLLSIAVLPFDNLTGNPADQDISDGIVEELLNELSRIAELRVVGRKASFYYRNKTENWQTIADTLGATMIIEGSIRRNNSTLRVAAQLINRAGFHLWSDIYDAPTDKTLDILAVQRNIAQKVADALPIQLSDESKQALQRVPTADERAYQLYLEGRSELRNSDQLHKFQDAETLFREALDLDPAFVDALSGLCETQLLIYQRSQRPQNYARALSSCARLTSEDNLNAEGFVALGTLNRLSGNYAEAKTLFEQALELSPSHEPAFYGMARAVEGLGQYAGAEQYYQQSVRVDPGYWRIYIGYGRYLERGGRMAEAIEKYQQVIRLAPDILDGYTNLGAAYFDNDQWDEAVKTWQKSADIEPDPIGYLNLGTVEYYLGNYETAAEHFRTGIDLWSEFYPLWGKLGAALERLEQAEESRVAFEKAADFAEAAAEVNAKDSRAMYYLASYLAHLGRFAEARLWSAKAVENSPADPAVHYSAAIVASLAGEDDTAIDALAETLRLGYSTRIIRHDTYFQPYLKSAKLAQWLSGDT